MIDFRAIAAEVRDNHRRLMTCTRHQFSIFGDKGRMFEKMTCLNCGGQMSLHDAGWYLRGYVAAGGTATDIIPDWDRPPGAPQQNQV